jgi:hypothetical protein
MNRAAAKLLLMTIFVVSGLLFSSNGEQTGKAISASGCEKSFNDKTKIIGFHVDMNISQFRGDYLKQELKMLADLGYNMILWEVENNIKWETCPECVSPDAFTKEEFKEILACSRKLGLEPIPLLQTIGHCEYVLKNEKYKPLAELPDRIDQYCPRNPEVVPFLRKWINEYLEVFGDVKYFHLGADEAYTLGKCPRCSAYAEEHSLSDLYISHMNAMSQPLIEKGVRPVIWGDMILHHPEALDKLSKKVVIYDWLYDRYYGSGEVQVWGQGNQGRDDLDAGTLERFGAYLYPFGDEPGRDPDPFYTADYLEAHGFDVVICPSSSSYGDSVFAPRTFAHMRNTYDSFREGLSGNREGAVLTSWTVHLFPWELQETSIELPNFIINNPNGDLETYQKYYVRKHFGVDDTRFFAAAGRLAKRGLFNWAGDLGFFKEALPTPKAYIVDRLDDIAKNGGLEKVLKTCESRLEEYRQGLAMFGEYVNVVRQGQAELKFWDLAARNLINRAEAGRILLKIRMNGNDKGIRAEAKRVLERLQALRKEMETAYSAQVKPSRTREILQWMYDSMETALKEAGQ